MNYGISELNYKNFILGSGWPSYKNVTITEMADALPDDDIPMNVPMYDTMPGTSRITQPDNGDVNPKDIKLMKALYNKLNKILMPHAALILDEYEYVDSPIYAEEGIDRETLAQIVSKTIDIIEKELDEAQEINLEMKQVESWSKSDLLTSLIQALVLTEIFTVRRPRYRRIRNNYRYSNGMYNGINPQ